MKIHKEVVGGSLILLIAFNIYNVLNFGYHFFMARMLTVAEYGILATLFSFLYILGVFSESVQMVITRYSVSEPNYARLKNLVKRASKRAVLVSLGIFLVYCVVTWFISDLVKIEYGLFILNGFVIFASFLVPIPRGVLQGRKKFFALGSNVVIEAVIKLTCAIFFVFILTSIYPQLRLYGALAGPILGLFIAFIFAFFFLKKIFFVDEEKVHTPNIYGYTWPVFFTIFAVLVFYNIDLIFARIFFSEVVAGEYAIASILSKTIFLATSPISKAIFSVASEKKDAGELRTIRNNSLLIMAGLVVIALIAMFFFPGLIVQIFSGKTVLGASSILFFLGVGISLISFANLILTYKLSQGLTKGYYLLFLTIAVEIFLLWRFSGDILQYSIAFTASSVLFFLASLALLNK